VKAIRVDFAPRSVRQFVAAMSPAHWLLAGLGLALLLYGALALRNLAQQQTRQQVQLEAAREQAQRSARQTRRADTAKSAISEEQASAVNAAIEKINLPWSSLLNAVEHATPASVAVLELTPDAQKHVLKGAAETATVEKMLAYITQLKAEPFFDKVYLTRHEVNPDSPVRALHFEFSAEWREAAP
jgi:hypothetical protein